MEVHCIPDDLLNGRATSSIQCEEAFSSATPYAEELSKISIFLFTIKTFANVISQATKIKTNIDMKKLAIATRRANMSPNRLVSSKWRPLGRIHVKRVQVGR